MTGSLFEPYFENYEVELAVRALQRGQRIKTLDSQKIPSARVSSGYPIGSTCALRSAAINSPAQTAMKFSSKGNRRLSEQFKHPTFAGIATRKWQGSPTANDRDAPPQMPHANIN